MKKIGLFLIVFFIIMLAGCTEDILIDAPKTDPANERQQIIFTMNMPNENNAKQATRIALEQEEMSLEQEGLTINLTWQENDLLHFYFVDANDGSKKATQTAEIKTISDGGKKATFEISIPDEITSGTGTFHLYGVYGGGGLDPTDPSKAILPLPEFVTSDDIEDLQSNKVVMLTFSQKEISVSEANIELYLEHLGSIFNIRVINNNSSPITGIETARLIASSPIGAHTNSGTAKYDLTTGDFSGTASDNTLSFDLSSEASIAAGGNIEFWGWFPVSNSNWPAMNLELPNTGDTYNTTVPTKARTAESGKTYYIVSAVDGANLQFAKISQEVYVETPGTLGSLLGSNATNLIKLKITGTLNNDDFNVVKGLQNLLYLDVANIDNTELINDLFSYNAVLKGIALPNGLTKINQMAFLRAHGLTSIELPASLTAIDQQAFSSTYITSITFPVGLQSIGTRAFEGSLRLTSVEIPQTVNSIGIGPFMSSNKLVEINVHPDNPTYKSIDGVLFEDFSPFYFDLIAYPTGKVSASYTVPEGVTFIRRWAFRDTKNIESIILPSTLTEIDIQAFERSTFTSLTSLAVNPPTINNANAFTNVPKNVEIKVPAGSVADYKAAPIWKDFTNISAL